MHILGLDVGTSSVKAAVLDADTALPVAKGEPADYALDHPTPDAAEMPAERLWQAVAAAARQTVRETRDGGKSIEGVGLACLTPGLVLLNKNDKPLSPIWTHLDRRSRAVARSIWQDRGEEFLQSTGNRPLPGGITVTSFRQQIEDDSSLHKRIARYLHVGGWLTLKMTGATAFEPGNASFTGLWGTVTDQKWSRQWCDYFDVNADWLPDVMDGKTTIGSLRNQAAEELGLPPGLPVKLGVADTSSAILLMNMTKDDLMHVVGTTQVVAALVDNPVPREDLLTRHLGTGSHFLQVAHNPVGGVALEWLRELCFCEQGRNKFYDQTVAEALQRETAVEFAPPYLGGDRLQIDPVRAGFQNLTLSNNRLDLLAAILKAMRQEHRKALQTLTGGRPFRRLFLTGGGADVVRKLIPEYADADVQQFEDGSLRGIARLFP